MPKIEGKLMKKIGIIGGIGPQSTIDYYLSLISLYQKRFETDHYPEIVIDSIDMTKMIGHGQSGDFAAMIDLLVNAARNLHRAGADFGVIASNTPHVVFDEVASASPIPLISIVEATCAFIEQLSMKKVGLFGTYFTMQNDFYKKVIDKYNIQLFVPTNDEQLFIHDRIFHELEFGVISQDTKDEYKKIIERMKKDHAIEGLILGCTELPLMFRDEFEIDGIRLLNTTKIHVESIINYYELL